MRNLIILAVLFMVVGLNAGDKKDWEKQRKIENKKRAQKYRKYATENKKYELRKCDKEEGGDVLAAAKQVLTLKKKLGAHLDKLADGK